MNVIRIDAFDMNFEECSASKRYKLKGTTGIGEKRIYVGKDEALLDEFFDLNNIESFLLLKKDLQKYLIEAKDEYFHPIQEYKENISAYYDDNVLLVNSIADNVLKLHFTKKYDSQKRYYLNFKNDSYSSLNYDFFRKIALPRVTKLNFVKVKDVNTGKLYVYIKPSFFIDEKYSTEKEIIENIMAGSLSAAQTYRKKQAQYRSALLEEMPFCVITKVAEDRILEACHIKPYKFCDENEKYDIRNGLVMTPTYHKLFDLGFISFNDNGTILVSPFLSNINKQRLNLVDNKQYRLPPNCKTYLAYHRANVYNQIPELQI